MHNKVNMLHATELYVKMLKMVNFMLWVYYHNEKKRLKKCMTKNESIELVIST